MYSLDEERIMIESIKTVCYLNLMARKASWAKRNDEQANNNNLFLVTLINFPAI